MSYRVAAASSDGIVVNQHFGRADQFYIIEVNERNEFKLIDIRTVSPICQDGEHNDSVLNEIIHKISDCTYVLVSNLFIIYSK